MGSQGSPVKSYDYLLKFLLVGDSDVGKGEILESLQDGAAESPYAYSNGIDYKTTTILLDGRRVKLELWDTSGQGRFCTIFRSYSRGAQLCPGYPWGDSLMDWPRGHLASTAARPPAARTPHLPAQETSTG
ncbi:RAB40C isoform 10 [Pongo abelii]|uniref:small monomeric GTPase n=1 Tax=Pongo abelii TaxID=9601 RepID=A0A2J8R1I8_PONAB|nr:RAB40C isoform 10 [Pongo abelii]